MSRNLRRILFYCSLVLFLALGAGIVFFAQGWRWDFETFTAEKVGAIYLRSVPAEANISLDGQPVRNKTGFFQAGTLINGLFPKEYTLTLTYPQFKTWERSVAVHPALVTEVKYAILVPEQATPVLSGDARNFWIVEDEPLVKNAKGELVLQDQLLPGGEVIGWTADAQRLLTLDPKAGTYHWNDLANATSVNVTALLRRGGVRLASSTKLAVDEENTNQVFVHASTSVALVDFAQSRMTVLATTTVSTSTHRTVSALSPSRFWLAWAEFDKNANESRLVIYDKFIGTRRTVGPVGGRTVQLKWTNNSLLGFFQDDGEFYLYRPGDDRPAHLASDVQDFMFTANGGMVATLGRTSMEVFNLRDREEYWRFDLPSAGKITGLMWYRDGQNIFVSYPDRTVLLELEDSKMENLPVIARTDKVHYDPEENQLYFLEEGKLMRIDFPED